VRGGVGDVVDTLQGVRACVWVVPSMGGVDCCELAPPTSTSFLVSMCDAVGLSTPDVLFE